MLHTGKYAPEPNKVKIDFHKVPFFGNMSKDGLGPDTRKVELIQQWPTPTNHNYLSRFLAFLSDLCAPLQSLLKKDTEFAWTSVHQHTFDQIRLHVSNDVKLQFHDANKPLYIEVDMSKKGIGVVMLQEDSIIWNESKSKIPTNLRHSINNRVKLF